MPYTPGIDLSESDINDVIHFFFLLDASGSMSGTAIQTLNEAMANVLPEIQRVADSKEITPIIHVLSFNSRVQWLCNTSAVQGIEARDIIWNDISASGGTDTAGAITEILEGLSSRHLGYHALRPIVVLITDGYSNDAHKTAAAVTRLAERQKTINIAVGVNGYNSAELDNFASPARVTVTDDLGNEVTAQDKKLVFPVDNASMLANVIRNLTISSMIASKLMNRGTPAAETPAEVEVPVDIVVVGDENGNIGSNNDVWL